MAKKKVVRKKKPSIEDRLNKLEDLIVNFISGQSQPKQEESVAVVENKNTKKVSRKQTGILDHQPSEGKRARTESFRIVKNRPNLFDNDPIFNAHKADSKIDKKLSGNNALTPRRPESKMIVLTCAKCKEDQEVNPTLAPASGCEYICDQCI